MRIDFVADAIFPYHKGGKEVRLHNLTTTLVAQGHEVHVHTMHWWPEPDDHKREDGVHLHALCPAYPMYNGTRRSISQALKFSAACLKLVKVPFDHLDVDHMPYFPVLTTWAVAKLRRKRLYATWHEALDRPTWVKYMGPAGVIAHAVERVSVKLPDAIGTASGVTREKLETRHGRSDRVHVVGTGVDLDTVRATRPTPEKVDVLYVGRLVKDKQVSLLVDAMRLVLAEQPGTTCVLLGRGPETERLTRQIRTLGMSGQIRIIPEVPHASDVYAYMKRARVFVLPSNREGFGMVAAEAIACGTPVVTVESPENAATHLIEPGATGSICEPNPESLAEEILMWLRTNRRPDPERVADKFDWQKIAKRQVGVYR